MKNLTTTIEKNGGFGNTITITKSFNKTVNGRKLEFEVYRKEYDVCDGYKSATSFSLKYNGEYFGSNDMKREQLNFFINEINNGTFDRN